MISTIGITGSKYHGKDTIADYIVSLNIGFQKYALADPIKVACEDIFDFGDLGKEEVDPYWGITPRHAYQRVGTELGRLFMSDIWIKHLHRRSKGSTKRVISDTRFDNEYDYIHSLVEATNFVIKVVMPEDHPLYVKRYDTHASEQGCKYDVLLINDGSKEDLYKKVYEVLRLYKLL